MAVGRAEEYDQGASDGAADLGAKYEGFFQHLRGLGSERRFSFSERKRRWVVECEGFEYSEYETGYLVGFLGANPHGLR